MPLPTSPVPLYNPPYSSISARLLFERKQVDGTKTETVTHLSAHRRRDMLRQHQLSRSSISYMIPPIGKNLSHLTPARTLMTTGQLLGAMTPTISIAVKLAEFLAYKNTFLTHLPQPTCLLLSLLPHPTTPTTTREMANCYSTPA